MWTIDLYQRMAGSFPGFQFDPTEASAWSAWVADLDEEATNTAAATLMMRPPHRFPSGPEVRRRVLENLGLFAPSFGEAQRLVSEVSAGRLSISEIAGPARRIDTLRVAEMHPRAVEALYAAVAEEHDRIVEAPGGVEVLRKVAEYLDLVSARSDRLALAQQCAGADPTVDCLPSDKTPDDVLDAIIRRYEITTGIVAELAAPVNPDERWEPAPNVSSIIAGLRRRSHQHPLGETAGDGAA